MQSGSEGHVFVVGADLARLSCDDALVPADRRLTVARSWRDLFDGEVVGDEAEDDFSLRSVRFESGRRFAQVPGPSPRQVWVVDTVDDTGRGAGWMLEGVEEALAAVAARRVDRPVHDRERRLVALPALGTGWGGAAETRGELLKQMLPVLRSAAAEHGFDLALVLRGRADRAAAQRLRRDYDQGWDLPDHLLRLTERLGDLARREQLAVFFGAGVSAAAGLPTWERMIEELAERAGLGEEIRGGLHRLPPQDAAALLARELGRRELEGYIQGRFGPASYALAHALVAGLPVHEFITTNYDPLVEMAASDIGRPVSVLPFDDATPDRPWLLKLHGDAAHPHSVVLTREEYLHLGDARAALTGVVDALLLTRHVLFVGASMLDDDLIRIAHQVRSALSLPGRGEGEARLRTGTVLALREDAARARLWEQDMETVAMAPPGAPAAEAARTLEVVLDRVGCLATPPTGYLLDPAYEGLLDGNEAKLARALSAVAEVLPDDVASHSVGAEVGALLDRLGYR